MQDIYLKKTYCECVTRFSTSIFSMIRAHHGPFEQFCTWFWFRRDSAVGRTLQSLTPQLYRHCSVWLPGGQNPPHNQSQLGRVLTDHSFGAIQRNPVLGKLSIPIIDEEYLSFNKIIQKASKLDYAVSCTPLSHDFSNSMFEYGISQRFRNSIRRL